MKTLKNFTQILLTPMALTFALSACGNKGAVNPQAPATPPQVTVLSIPEEVNVEGLSTGLPVNVAGTWRGRCNVTSQDVSSPNCEIVMSVQQNAGRLNVAINSSVGVNAPSSRRTVRSIFVITGNQLIGNHRSGIIGAGGFSYITPVRRVTVIKTGRNRIRVISDALEADGRVTRIDANLRLRTPPRFPHRR